MKNKPESLSVENVRYVREDLAGPKPETVKQIVILQRGWVAVGDFRQDGDNCELHNASIIRRWGTTKGLGELAEKGPLPNTILDPCYTLRFHALTIVARMDVEVSKW